MRRVVSGAKAKPAAEYSQDPSPERVETKAPNQRGLICRFARTRRTPRHNCWQRLCIGGGMKLFGVLGWPKRRFYLKSLFLGLMMVGSTGSLLASQVTLAWDAANDPTVMGYNVF